MRFLILLFVLFAFSAMAQSEADFEHRSVAESRTWFYFHKEMSYDNRKVIEVGDTIYFNPVQNEDLWRAMHNGELGYILPVRGFNVQSVMLQSKQSENEMHLAGENLIKGAELIGLGMAVGIIGTAAGGIMAAEGDSKYSIYVALGSIALATILTYSGLSKIKASGNLLKQIKNHQR